MIEHLNVGGTPFSIDKAVLSRDPSSMLAVMFGGRFSNKTDRTGRVFIDRDGERFRYVVDFLTEGKLLFADKAAEAPSRRNKNHPVDRLMLVHQLQAEAHYFNLQSMCDALVLSEQQLQQEIMMRRFAEESISVLTIRHSVDVWCVRMMRRQGILLTGDNDGRVRIWSLKTGTLLQTLERHRSAVTCLDCTIADEGQGRITRLVSGSLDRSIRVWDLQSGECVQIFTDHESALHSVQLDGDILASSAGDGTVRLFDLRSGLCFHVIRTSSNDVRVLLRDGIGVVTAGCAIWIWDMTLGHSTTLLCSMLDPRVGNILSVAWNGPSNDEIVTGTSEGGICFWSLSRGGVVRTITELGAFAVNQILVRSGMVFSCSFLPTSAHVWDAQTGRPLRRVDAACLSPQQASNTCMGMFDMDVDVSFDESNSSISPLLCLTSRLHSCSSGSIKIMSFGSQRIS